MMMMMLHMAIFLIAAQLISQFTNVRLLADLVNINTDDDFYVMSICT